MINSLNIGKVIYDKLHSITNNIYPLVAENGTNYPFIIYTRDTLNSTYCKDGCYEDSVGVSIKIATATYYGGVDIAQQVREKLTFNGYKTDGMELYSQLDNASEDYVDNTYLQILNFTITINNI